MALTSFIKKQILKAARQYGIKPSHLAGQQFIESGFNPEAVSSAAAFGISQFIPSTAAAYGVKPGSSKKAIKSQIQGQAHYLDDLGYERGNRPSIVQALGNYYGSTSSDYASRVLAAAKDYRSLNKGNLAPLTGGGGGGKPRTTERTAGAPVDDPTTELNSILAALTPDTAAGKRVPSLQPGYELLGALSAEQAAQEQAATAGAARQKLEGPSAKLDLGGGKGKVIIADGADRPGVKTSRAVLQFAKQISALVGRPLTIGTGTNHSQYTVDNNVSDHWSGNAADIPARGNFLTRLGQMALIAAGMSRRKARKIKGGLFNIGGHQIIFNTMSGGDHYDHLHISA